MTTRHPISRAFSGTRVILASLVVVFFYFIHLGVPVLWNDEADTGALGQSVLNFGIPIACDGIGKGKVTVQPWVQYYVSALSQEIFGRTTLGVRVLFAFIGWLTFFPLFILLKSRTPRALSVTVLLLLSPQVLLFQRNARYYPVVIFLFTFLLFALFCARLSRKLRYGCVICSSLLFFHSHYIAAISAFLALLAVTALWDRRRLAPVAWGATIGFASWLPAFFCAPSLAPSGTYAVRFLAIQPGRWLAYFFAGMKATLCDLDFCNCFPLSVYAALAGYCFISDREKFIRTVKDPLIITVFLALLIEAVLICGSIGYETGQKLALLRYIPHLILFLPLPFFLLLQSFMQNRLFALSLFATTLALNIFGVSTWKHFQSPREWRISWWPAVYSEILFPPVDSMRKIIEAVRLAPKTQELQFSVSPEYQTGTFVFYTDKRFSFTHRRIGGYACSNESGEQSQETPNRASLVIQLQPQQGCPLNYLASRKFPTCRASPDATRPELTRHEFCDTRSTTFFLWCEPT